MEIKIYDLLKSHNASLHDDGLAVYNFVIQNAPGFGREEILLDFTDIKRCSSLFLNASIGKLLVEFGEVEVQKTIHPTNYNQILNFMSKYEDVLDNFSNTTNYQAYRDEAFA